MKLIPKVFQTKLLTPTFMCLWFIMFMVEFIKGAMLVTILPVYIGHVLQMTTFTVGLSISMQYIGDNLFRSPSGWLVERIGFRWTMAIGLSMIFISVALIAFTSEMPYIVLGCALLGIGSAPLWPCVMMGTSAVTDENNNFGTAMGVIQIACLGGAGAGPVLINFFIGGSYRPVFWILLACMALTIVVSLFLPGKQLLQNKVSNGLQPENKRESLLNGGLGKMWSNLRFMFRRIRDTLHVSWIFYPALFLQSFAIGLLTPVITLFIRTVLNLSPATYSGMLIVGGGITLIGLVPVGRMVDRYGTKWFLHGGFLLAAVSIGLFAVTRSIPLIWGLVGLIGVSYALILPTWDTMISHMVPEGEKGTVWGLFLTIQGSGMVLGPSVSGKLWDVLGPSAPFLASAIVMTILFFLHLKLTHPSKGQVSL